MRLLHLAQTATVEVTSYGSKAAGYAAIARLSGQAVVGVVRLNEHGQLGRHEAAAPQIAVVLAGSGQSSGADGEVVKVGPGDAIVWDSGEEHETKCDTPMVLLILETEAVSLVKDPDDAA
ncbi:MAG: cupin domain-containing protein [Candidatus Dormibacteria bacterium]